MPWNAVSGLSVYCQKTNRAKSENLMQPGPEVIKKKIMLNAAEHEFFPAHKC